MGLVGTGSGVKAATHCRSGIHIAGRARSLNLRYPSLLAMSEISSPSTSAWPTVLPLHLSVSRAPKAERPPSGLHQREHRNIGHSTTTVPADDIHPPSTTQSRPADNTRNTHLNPTNHQSLSTNEAPPAPSISPHTSPSPRRTRHARSHASPARFSEARGPTPLLQRNPQDKF